MNRPRTKRPPAPAAPRTAADRAAAARLLAAAKTGADVRGRKVRRVRAAIRARAYENDLKLAVAVERLCEAVIEGNAPGARGD
jgi:hypothetical protein